MQEHNGGKAVKTRGKTHVSFRELQVEVCCFPARVEFCVCYVSCVLCLSNRSWVEFETSRRRSRVEVRLGSRISQTEVDTPTNQTLLLLLPLLPRVSCCCFSTFFFSFLFFWLHFAHKNTNMATERRLHLFLSMCCCCFWLFCYFLFSCGTKEFIFFVCWN